MKKLCAILVCVFTLISCASTAPLSMKPNDAKVPELVFFYLKAGKWIRANGQGADYFAVGEKKQFKVRVSPEGGECVLYYQDGDTSKTFNCTDQNEVVMDLGTYYKNHPTIVGFSVAMKKLGIQFANFYPVMGTKRAPLPISFKCPQQDTGGGNISTCSRPATYSFNMTVSVKAPGTGKLQYVKQCAGDPVLQSYTQDTNGPADFTYTLSQGSANYCAVSFNFKSDDGTVAQQQLMNVRFYNEQYIPLGVPTVTKTANGFQVCAAENYDAVTVNGEAQSSMSIGDCKEFQVSNLDFTAWDQIGRVTWAAGVTSAVMDISAVANSKTVNGNIFYKQAYPYFYDRMKQCKEDLTCLKATKTALLRSPKVTQAVSKWDATRLYK